MGTLKYIYSFLVQLIRGLRRDTKGLILIADLPKSGTTWLESINGFNEEYRIAADFDLMLCAFLSVQRDEVYIDKNKVVNMYLGGVSNASISNILKGNREIFHAFASSGILVTYVYTLKRLINKFLSKW